MAETIEVAGLRKRFGRTVLAAWATAALLVGAGNRNWGHRDQAPAPGPGGKTLRARESGGAVLATEHASRPAVMPLRR